MLALHDFTNLPFSDGAFDALLSFNVIYHSTLVDLQRTLAEIGRVVRPGGELLLTFVGRHEGLMASLRVDVARGVCREIEPFTFIYIAEITEDRDLPHHYVDEAEIRLLLAAFEVTLLHEADTSFVDEEGVFHPNKHYLVQGRRPL
jgi:SAM-dependent methyltransferase